MLKIKLYYFPISDSSLTSGTKSGKCISVNRGVERQYFLFLITNSADIRNFRFLCGHGFIFANFTGLYPIFIFEKVSGKS